MQLNSRLFAYNNSKVVGGQEAYLLLLKNALRDFDFSIIGNPESISSQKNLPVFAPGDILVLNGNKSLYDMVLTRHIKQPSVYIQHSDIDDSQGPLYKRIIRKFLLYFCLKKVDAVIRVCNKCIPDRYAKGKITTVYNGVELKTEVPRELSDKLNLLMVGAINENKNQKLAIEALVHIKDATLTLVGPGSDLYALKSLAIDLGVSERVHWVGFQDDPTRYYEKADLLLMLSKNEAFPFVVLEAMAQGVPVVAVPVGGVPEAVQHLDNGLLLDGYQPEQLALAIHKIRQDRALYTTLSKNSITTIKNKFSLEQMTQGFLTVVDQVLEKRGVK
ncbi:glycosyltransferase family 4 protein [Vibrio cyclitrophicus]|uniref:glycosyltransferase family 4 protein n=1 Tax=Vibrio cyclitrophicus TaxID=47951 RepID=UPI00148C2A61|nr:glycosyltransferase family 4 protein [Vibrio cyclitrophicus]NOH45050.1 glycosyltransferase family 4 protein [Vibrio cyclitrophicus]